VRILALIALGVSIGVSSALAQQPTSKVTRLLNESVSGQPDKEFQVLSIEWPLGSGTPRHTHLGDEYVVVMAGAFMVKQGSEDWKTYTAGQSWHVPAGVVHESKSTVEGTKTINCFIVEKGKPLVQPVQ
jgi:quercetin dioxygenase-like cupin family protein